MTNEEKLILQIIEQGDNLIKKKDWKQALHIFNEADSVAEKWKDLYGSRIYASLAYCYANLGNKT